MWNAPNRDGLECDYCHFSVFLPRTSARHADMPMDIVQPQSDLSTNMFTTVEKYTTWKDGWLISGQSTQL